MIAIGLHAAAAILALAFAVRRRRLHPLALSLAWMLTVFFEDAYYTFYSLNLAWIDVSDRVDHVWIRVMAMYLISPLILVWTLDASAGARRHGARLAILAAGAASLLAVDTSLDMEGVWIMPADWPLWAWAAKPLLLLAVVGACTGAFRLLLRKERIAG